MKTINGSGSLPIISGVTFHTSPNNSYTYIGDKLTITLTPKYVVAKASNYTSSHNFASNAINSTAFSNWYNYMKVKADTSIDEWDTNVMIYNAYVDANRSLSYPYDASVVNANGVVNTSLQTQPNYSNTAYRYEVTKTTDEEKGTTTITRRYDAITAGNRYNGGLGVYVIPGNDLVTISVSFSYNWYNWETKQLAGLTDSGMVKVEYSDEIQTIVTEVVGTKQTTRNYYAGTISSPTYVNVLDYIRLTGQNSETIIKGGYRLLLNNISVGIITTENRSTEIKTDVTDNTNVWTGTYSKTGYEIHNSTITSPILARVKDVAADSKEYETTIAITNNNSTPMKVSGFTISSKLYYYEDEDGNHAETAMGESAYLPANGLIFDNNLWGVSYSAGVFNFSLVSGKSIYIPSGYSLTLISGVKIPSTSACQSDTEANDFWCALSVDSITTSTSGIDYSQKTSTSVEVITEGYYTAINTNKLGYIYIRNNSRQVITGVTLTGLQLSILDDESTMITRDRATANDATYTTSGLSGSVSIKPGEMVLAYTITPTTANVNAIIKKFDISVGFATKTVSGNEVAVGEETNPIDLEYTETTHAGMLINNGTKCYEFRLVSTTDLSGVLNNSGDFVARKVSDTKYYYYYKGIICPERSIKVFKGFAPNVEVEYLEHKSTQNSNYYVVGNYTAWELSTEVDEDIQWLNAMKKLYDEPSASDRANASVIA
jgi:hypothetical protein